MCNVRPSGLTITPLNDEKPLAVPLKRPFPVVNKPLQSMAPTEVFACLLTCLLACLLAAAGGQKNDNDNDKIMV